VEEARGEIDLEHITGGEIEGAAEIHCERRWRGEIDMREDDVEDEVEDEAEREIRRPLTTLAAEENAEEKSVREPDDGDAAGGPAMGVEERDEAI
jgi:hypothetical protein